MKRHTWFRALAIFGFLALLFFILYAAMYLPPP